MALAMAPFVVQALRRGWSRPRDLAHFYLLFGTLLWGVWIGHYGVFLLPSRWLLVATLAATVLYWFGFARRGARLLEPGANRPPTGVERRLIQWMPVMGWALFVEAVAVALSGTWLGRFVRPLYPVSVTLLLLTLGLCVIAARGWKEGGRLL